MASTQSHVHLSPNRGVGEERIIIDPENAAPYKWICRLKAVFDKQGPRAGTGFLINIPGSTQCVILTAAHNLYARADKDNEHQGYPKRLTIAFPGRQEIVISDRKSFKVLGAYEREQNLHSDYGIIILPETKPEEQSCGFGIAAVLSDRQILNADLSVFGYPTLEPHLWGSGGRVQSVDQKTLRYVVQTTKGQSGSPVFLWYEGFWVVVGIHVRFEQIGGLTINSAIRLNTFVMNFIIGWIDYRYREISLSPSEGKFLSISDTAPKGPGEYGKLGIDTEESKKTKLRIIPVRSYPEGSDRPFSSNQWVILSRGFYGTFICIDTTAIKKFKETRGNSIGVCSHLTNTPILRRSCELVTLTPSDPNTASFKIKSVRFPDEFDWKLKVGEETFDISKLRVVNSGGTSTEGNLGGGNNSRPIEEVIVT